jgi:hypothetical protein
MVKYMHKMGVKMVNKDRTTVTMDRDLKGQAQKQGINISAEAEAAVGRAIQQPSYYLVNTNRSRLPREMDGTRIYRHGYVATFGPGKFGRKLAAVDPGDVIFSYVSDHGVCAVGECKAAWAQHGIIGPNNTPSEVDREGTTLEESTTDEASVEILTTDRRVFPELNRPEYLLPVCWHAVLPLEDAVKASELRSMIGWTPSQTLAEVSPDDDPEHLAERIEGRRDRLFRR